jgi:hypothetical protein
VAPAAFAALDARGQVRVAGLNGSRIDPAAGIATNVSSGTIAFNQLHGECFRTLESHLTAGLHCGAYWN